MSPSGRTTRCSSPNSAISSTFPDPVSHRITLPDLHRPEIRARRCAVWLDPHSLDPAKFAAKVAHDIAGRLSTLAKSLKTDGHDPQVITGFLQRKICRHTFMADLVDLVAGGLD